MNPGNRTRSDAGRICRSLSLLRHCALFAAIGSLSACAIERSAVEPSIRHDVWRDLNHNGSRDPYEDSRLSAERRTEDLLRRMTLDEKVGTMMHGTLATIETDGSSAAGYDLPAIEKLIGERKITSFITRLTLPPARLAEANNAVQAIAARSRLGIPVTISTDPRHHFQAVLGFTVEGAGFTQWPETLGFAAIGDPNLVRRFGAIAAAEYRAVGIHMALSPQADLATEPRWPRVTATFGSDAAVVSSLAGAYVQGFQGGADGLRRDGVAAVVKHWVGYGAQPEGFDAHNHYGRFAKLDERSFQHHVAAFRGALAAGSAGVMPTYAVLQGVRLNGRPLEPVGAGFSRQLLTELLREQLGYRGLIVSDWAITNDCVGPCIAPTAANPQDRRYVGMPWGVEALSKEERFAKGVSAGIDQFGGIDDPAHLLAAVRSGKVPEDRIDQSVRRVLLLKFRLGLFDNPLVEPAAAERLVGSRQAEADAAQRRALVLLENRRALLPVAAAGKRVWLHGLSAEAAERAGFKVAANPAEAELAIVRMATPFERLHPFHFFGSRHNEGRLDFRVGDPSFDAFRNAASTVPTIAVIDMDRPAILSNVRGEAAVLLVAFGASDSAVLDIISGRASPEGRLPFELPSSMEAVRVQEPGRPDDSPQPLYRAGAGLELSRRSRPSGR